MGTAFERFRHDARGPRGGTTLRSSFWEVVYEKNLRTMASQVFAETLSVAETTLTASDGTQWSLHVANGSGSFVEGTGAVLQSDQIQMTQVYNAYAGLRFVVLCPSLPDWDANRDTAVQVRFAGDPQFQTEVGATAYTAPAGLGYGPGDNNATVRLRFPGEFGAGADVNWADINNTSQVAFRAMTSPFAECEKWVLAQSVQRADYRIRAGFYLREDVPIAEWPVLEDMHPVAGCSDGIVSSPLKVGFYVGAYNGAIATYTATDIRVLQKDRA